MGRIRDAYRLIFRDKLGRLKARRVETGVEWLMRRAEAIRLERNVSEVKSLMSVNARLQSQIDRWQANTGRPSDNRTAASEVRFFCDSGLGGLARWLRAAGYRADWEQQIDDAAAIQFAAARSAILLTTDSMLMERKVIRSGSVTAMWLPPALSIAEQLQLVLETFRLPVLESRCMRCGGELRQVNKETVRERIPPRTYLWRDDYFECEECGQLFWHGTHWERIRNELRQLK
jgi:uncharacterized protein